MYGNNAETCTERENVRNRSGLLRRKQIELLLSSEMGRRDIERTPEIWSEVERGRKREKCLWRIWSAE